MPVIPLLFARPSQDGPLRVSNPIRCNRRNLSQPYPLQNGLGAPLGSHLPPCRPRPLSARRPLGPAGAFSVRARTKRTLFVIAFHLNIMCIFPCHSQRSHGSAAQKKALLRKHIAPTLSYYFYGEKLSAHSPSYNQHSIKPSFCQSVFYHILKYSSLHKIKQAIYFHMSPWLGAFSTEQTALGLRNT